MRSILLLALPLVTFTWACGGASTPPVDAGSDAGGELDAGLDAGVADAGSDAGQPIDAGVDAGPLALAAGDVAEVVVAGTQAQVSLATPNGDEKFIVILASTRLDTSNAPSSYALSVAAPVDGGAASLVTGCALDVEPWRSTAVVAETPPSGTAVALDTMATLNMQTATGYEAITVKAIAVGTSAVVWADVTPAHPANMDPTFVAQFLTDFETKVLPRERSIFGVESDLDGDGHIGLVFTPLTYQTAVAFFTGCDLKVTAGCPASNHGEYLYLTPPATIPPPYNTANAIKEILTHECSHLIHFNRKVMRNNLGSWRDSSYLIEGIGGFAQDAVGPQAGNLYVAKAGLDGINQFSLSDTLLDNVQYDTARDGLLRGGSYLFVRYLYDRAGGDQLNLDGSVTTRGGPALWRALLDSPLTVSTVLPTAIGHSKADLAVDFYTTLAMSNRDQVMGVAPTNACFAYLPAVTDPTWTRQRGANVYAKFSLTMTGPATQTAAAADGVLRAGGVEYLTINAVAGKPSVDLTVTVDPAALPRVRVGRLH